MKPQNKYIVSILVSVLLYGGTLQAGTMDDFLALQISSSPAQSYRTENVIGYAGGDMRIRWGGSSAIKLPINVQAPKLNIGCGGIDAELGGFGFLKDKLVMMMQNIAAAAPAFAFQLALKTLCSQCAATIQELQNIADQINALAMNGCGLSSAMADWTYGKMQKEGMIETTPEKERGYFASAFSNGSGGNLVSDYLTKAQDFLNGKGFDGQAAVTKMQGSWLEGSLSPASRTSLETIIGTDAIPMMRAMIGDVYGYVGDNGIVYKPFDPVWGKQEILKFVGYDASYNATLPTIKITNAVQKNTTKYAPPNVVEGVVPNFNGLREIFRVRISNILSVLGTPGATLDANDVKFISNLPIPVYKILNNEIVAKGYGNADIELLSNYIATREAIALLEMVAGSAQKYLASFKLEKATWEGNGDSKDSPSPLEGGVIQQNFFNTLNQNLANIRNTLHLVSQTASDDFIKAGEQKIKTRNIERQLKAAMAKTGLYNKAPALAW